MTDLERMLRIAGWLHLWLVASMVCVPKIFDWRAELAKLEPFLRRLFLIYGAFIALTVIGLGTITVWQAEALAQGTPLARVLCGFMAVFWAMRLVVQLFVMKVYDKLQGMHWKLAYHSLTAVFGYLVAAYVRGALAL